MPNEPNGHLITVITRASLRGHRYPKILVSENAFPHKVYSEHKLHLNVAKMLDKAFKKLDFFQILILVIINTNLFQIYQSI